MVYIVGEWQVIRNSTARREVGVECEEIGWERRREKEWHMIENGENGAKLKRRYENAAVNFEYTRTTQEDVNSVVIARARA